MIARSFLLIDIELYTKKTMNSKKMAAMTIAAHSHVQVETLPEMASLCGGKLEAALFLALLADIK